jgi:itaconate CoA-transferase
MGVTCAIQNEPEWARFCEGVLERPALPHDARFASNTSRVAHRDELNQLITATFAQHSAETVESRLPAARIAFGGVNTVAEFLEHPVLRGRDRWRETPTETGNVEALLPPIDLSVEPRMGPAPALGAHTEQIIAELGRDPQNVGETGCGTDWFERLT